MEVSVPRGECYKMVPLPDSMVDTTLFVGNLNEFVHDDDLSHFFCAVSRLQSLSACVVRKANMMSLEYGFCQFSNCER
jgi:RNA recognition motif-containing protein